MNDDQTFRHVLIAAAATLFPIAFYFRVKSQASGESLDRRKEGWFILLTLRPLGIASMLGLVAYMVDPSYMVWSSVPLPRSLRWVGVGLGAIGGALLIWTFRTLGRNLTDTVVTRKEHTLVTHGPYRWVRHPFYVTVALTILANSLVSANWFILVTGMLTLSLLIVRTKREEAHLIARFGEAYEDYMKRTGRFFPRSRGT